MILENRVISGRPLLSFDDILEREDYVICDSGIADSGIEDLYPLNHFLEIPTPLLKRQLGGVELFLQLLEDPGVITVPGVSREIKIARELLGSKLRYLLADTRRLSNGNRKRLMYKCRNKIKRLKRIQELHHILYQTLKRKAFAPREKPVYNFLESVVLSVAKNSDAKIDFGNSYGHESPRPVEDFHTDEQLVAMAIYLSCVEGKSGGILTGDSDIKRILRNTIFYLAHSGHAGYREIINLVAKNPIKVYHIELPREAGISWDSSWNFSRGNISFISQERMAQIRAELGQ